MCSQVSARAADSSSPSRTPLPSSKYDAERAHSTASTDPAPVVNYSAPGDYQATLIASSGAGCSDTTTVAVRIYPSPEALFSAPPVCLGTSTIFSNQSSVDPVASIATYHWSMPGAAPSVSMDLAPTVNYTSAGSYDVSLVAVTSDGCVDTLVQNITVYHPPSAAISNGDSACVPICHQFQDLSTSIDGAIVQWNWHFPGSTFDSSHAQTPPLACYDRPGTYGATLEVVSNTGCRSSLAVNDLIRADRKSTRLNSSHVALSRMPSSA